MDAVLEGPAMVVEGWAWTPDRAELIPDVTVIDDAGEEARFTGIPRLVVEVPPRRPPDR